MSQQITLKESRRRIAQLTNYEDGLWDILLGLIFLMLSIYPVSREILGPERNLVVFLVTLGIANGVYFLARKVITEPRIGVAKTRRTRGTITLLIVTVALVLVTFGLVLATLLTSSSSPQPTQAAPGLGIVDYAVSLILILVFSVLGYMFDVTRLYFYGWLLGIASLASAAEIANGSNAFNLPMALASAIILVIGLTLLIRFKRKYSIPEGGL